MLRRCAVTDDPYFQMYYIPPVLLSALVCSARSEIPVATACRRSGSRVGVARRGKEEKKERGEKRKRTREEVEERGERPRLSATRGEKKKK